MTPFRTPAGGRIDRGKPIRFTFDGMAYTGQAGDTLASALLANGVHLVGRSFKYHRPRGIVAAGAEEPNALVTVDRGGGREVPNLRATQVEIYEGLTAISQNRWPSLKRDLGAVNDLLSPLFPAGFYYKTFKWPRSFWAKVYEPAIRRSAGLGRAPKAPDPDRYAQLYAHCDVLVIGGGPTGIAAALAAAEAGARVILCDEQPEFGGSLLHDPGATIDGKAATEWIAESLAALGRRDAVVLPRTTGFGYFAHNFVGLAERITDHLAAPGARQPRERLWQVRAKEVVLAAGAIERPLAFPQNDRPGIMLAEAARTYLNRYGVRPGTRAVVITDGDSAYRAALDLAAAGIAIAAIADTRAAPPGPLVDAARAAGIVVHPATTIIGTEGRRRVHSARLAPVGGGPEDHVSCDLILMSGGWTPAVHLFSQSRGKLRYDEALGAFVPGTSAQRERSAGGCRGTYELDACIGEGHAAGREAAAAARRSPAVSATVSGDAPAAPLPGGERSSQPGDAERGRDVAGEGALPRRKIPKRAFVDFQNDVTVKDLALALREGFRSIEHVKRYTTTGMATDQGKTSNMTALEFVATSLGKAVPAVGTTTFRQPYTPVTFGVIAGAARGDLFEPVRRTPIHSWAAENGAVFEDVGLWKRAWYFPKAGEDMHEAVARECRAVREGAGIFDASTLGKIEVVGPDAAEFMNRLYTNAWTKLEPGRCRYGLMLTEAGFIMDDGVVGRLAPDRFHVTTTTGGAPRVLHHMEDYLQTEFPDLKVWLTSTTEQWAVIAVQGPKARDVIVSLVDGIDIARDAMPHMSVRLGKVAGVPARLFRVSFTGELGFEINVPARHGRAVWEAVHAAGQAHGIAPYGTETMHVLRAEKGYIIVGQESDGTVIPADLGLDGMIGKTKPDFVGKRSLARPDMQLADRKQLVGLLATDPKVTLEEGAQVVEDPNAPVPMRMLGHVTSSYASAALGRSIALALVSGGRARKGMKLFVPALDGTAQEATVTDPVFYDPEGKRLDG
ncbi:MAG: sarcosine oxidase subunit alpha family protein [Rhizobiales bacterium]|nr:sarcosine oxidase subunit alpha family protein [Hyphomicrobiales bacterium]